MKTIWTSLLVSIALLFGIAVFSTNAHGQPKFVPNDQKFWDNSANWTTDYGPAYRDTILAPEDMVPCNGPFALCFTSGQPPRRVRACQPRMAASPTARARLTRGSTSC
jgi:hypothetical protein